MSVEASSELIHRVCEWPREDIPQRFSEVPERAEGGADEPQPELLNQYRIVSLIAAWEHQLMVANQSDDWSAHQIKYCTNLRDTIVALKQLHSAPEPRPALDKLARENLDKIHTRLCNYKEEVEASGEDSDLWGELLGLETWLHLWMTRAAQPQAAPLADEDGPGEEDGPWAEGWEQRTAQLQSDGQWNPYGNSGMRHMENSDVAGGATDQPLPAPGQWTIMGVCHAYESGFGDGIQSKPNRNVRPKTSPEHEAYNIGHQWGVERQKLRPSQPQLPDYRAAMKGAECDEGIDCNTFILVLQKKIADQQRELARLQRPAPPPGAGRVIELTRAEIQSNYNRVQWAEGLIRQLPETHDGRNSWLLNYGTVPTKQPDQPPCGGIIKPEQGGQCMPCLGEETLPDSSQETKSGE